MTRYTIWLAPLIWMALIFIVSGTPSDDLPTVESWDPLLKKGGHMVAYALLTTLWQRALETRRSSRRAAWLALGITLLYAISDEYHQTFIPGRNGTGLDVLVDMAGALGGLWIWQRAGRQKRKHSL